MLAQHRPAPRDDIPAPRLAPASDELPVPRLAPVPDAAPPYDGDPPGARPAGPPGAGGTPAGEAGPAWPPGPVPPVRTAPGEAPGHAGTASDAEWAGRFARVLAESLAGSRPARQIIPWTTERARVHLRRLGPLLACGQRPRILRVATSHPAADVMETTIIAGFGPRTRALAVRFERTARRAPAGRATPTPQWLCTDIESG